jgi:Collagen triple helix repeat (20 copies)
MLAYLRRHHIGLLALFIALGGTSYAAAKLPRNSVGTTQLKSGAVTEVKLAQAIRDQLNRPAVLGSPGAAGPKGDTGAAGAKGETGATGATGPAGPAGVAGAPGAKGDTGAAGATGAKGDTGAAGATGAQGPKGDTGKQGDQGPKGDTGATGPAGPTSGGVGGTNTNITPSAGTAIQAPVTVTLAQPGKVLVLIMGTFSVRCTSAGDCDRTISATVGGTTVPGAFGTINGDAGVNTEATINSAGVLTNVPAGTHTVSLANQITGPSNGSGNKGDVRIVAIALG